MTHMTMIDTLNNLGADVTYWESKNIIYVTINDFDGFDEEWNELDRDYDNEEAVNAFLEMLDRECVSHEGDFSMIYHFENFTVQVDYASWEI